jgi:superfamily II DNA or RNA helicase
MELFMTTGGVYIRYKTQYKNYIDYIKKRFTLENVGFRNSVKIAHGYVDYAKRKILCMPKYRLLELLDDSEFVVVLKKIGYGSEIKQIISVSLDQNDKIRYSGSVKSYQKIIIDKVFDEYFLNSIRSGVILKLPTGHGKTYVAMAIISKLKLPTLIVCPRCSIAKQWCKLLSNMFPDITVGSYFTNSHVYSDTIMVSVIDSLSTQTKFKFADKTIEYKTFFKMWPFSIFDECHNYCTHKKDMYRRLASVYTLGLSATPNQRNDGFGKIPLWNIGPVLDACKMKNYMREYTKGQDSVIFQGKVYEIRYIGPQNKTITYTMEDGLMDYRKTVNQINEDLYRRKLILNIISELTSRHECILVYSEWLGPLKQLLSDISQNGLMMTKKIFDVITGGAKDQKVINAFNNANIIYTTYKYFGEGISVPRITAIVYVNPRKNNTEQYNGRLLRPSSEENENVNLSRNSRFREIVDIVDWGTGLRNSYRSRLKNYKKLLAGGTLGTDFQIERITVDHTDVENFRIKD